MDEPLILNRYRPLAILGEGGHGSVVLAFDTKMARRVAIKRMPLPRDSFGRPPGKIGLGEARTAALLNHPNIITVHEWDTDSDEAFIVMEDVGGASLAEILDTVGGPLDLDAAAAIVAQAVTGLSFAHDNGVLHLDLKPANILITPDGRVKIGDFGVSALTGPNGRALGIAGTIGYMPPEQIRAEELDERADVWALAALTYEILTDANPFDADTIEGSLFKIEVADVPLPSEFEHTLSAEIDDVLMAALAPDPADRYPSVTSFSRAIGPQLGNPQTGRDVLARLVEETAGPPAAEGERIGRLGLWDRLAPYASTARHTSAAVVCAWLAWTGVSAFPVDTPVRAGAAALVGLAGLLAPDLGLALGLGAVAAGTFSAVGPIPAAVFAAIAFVFWLLKGRSGTGAALVPWAAPLVGAARAALALPLLIGFQYPPLAAALAALLAGLVVTTLSLVTGQAVPYLAISPSAIASVWPAIASGAAGVPLPGPGIALALAAWPVSAAISSLACRRASRIWAAVGMIVGLAVLAGGYYLWGAEFGGGFTLLALLPDAAIALAIVAIVIALGAPVRPEEESET